MNAAIESVLQALSPAERILLVEEIYRVDPDAVRVVAVLHPAMAFDASKTGADRDRMKTART